MMVWIFVEIAFPRKSNKLDSDLYVSHYIDTRNLHEPSP